MTLLIIVLTRYLTYVFWECILTITRVVVGGDIYQVYICGQSTGYCITQLWVATISSSFLRIWARGLGICSCQDSRLTISRLGLFFFTRLEGFLLFIRLPALLKTRIYLPNTCRGLKCSFEFSFNSLIKHFFSKV